MRPIWRIRGTGACRGAAAVPSDIMGPVRLTEKPWSRVGVPAIALTLLIALAATASGSPAGGWLAGAPASQHFPQFGRCPVAPANRYLASHSGCVSVRRADVEGHGQQNLVVLFARLNAKRQATSFALELVSPQGTTTKITVPRSGMNMTIARLRNVNGVPGVEIFVHEGHVTTEELMGVYALDGHSLRRAARLPYGGEDAGIRFGFTCHTASPASIVEHKFEEQAPFKGVWKRTDTTYQWVGASLHRVASKASTAKPTPAEVGAHC
jgi:hypothetical protein